jgi:hypothetical protein
MERGRLKEGYLSTLVPHWQRRSVYMFDVHIYLEGEMEKA